MGLFNRKSDAEVDRTRANDVETAHRARKWGLASAETFESRVVAADSELARRSQDRKAAAQREADERRTWTAVAVTCWTCGRRPCGGDC